MATPAQAVPLPIDLFGQVDASLGYDFALATSCVLGFWFLCLGVLGYCPIYDTKDHTGGRVPISTPTLKQRMDAADLLFSIPFFPLMVALAFIGTYEIYSLNSAESRWHTMVFASRWFQVLYVSRMLTHMPIQWYLLQDQKQHRLNMTAHHILSVICYGGGLATGRLHFWAAFDGCCEITTIFLNGVFCVKVFAPAEKYPFLTPFFGVMLWIGFVIFRLMLFPVWLWWFYRDLIDNPAQTWDRVSVLELSVYPIVTSFLLVLSVFWMIPITRGLVKAVLGAQSSMTSKTDKSE